MALNPQLFAQYLAKLHLLKVADTFMLCAEVMKHSKSNQNFLRSNPGFVPPPAHLAYDAYNHTHWKSYHDMGVVHARLIADLIKQYIIGDGIKVCEWGCGPGRVIRHLQQIEGFSQVDLYGSDYNASSIHYCQQTLTGTFTRNHLEPPLAFDSEAFDCVYAISIFTHLSERLHFLWMKELLRLVRPTGILIFTTHGDACTSGLLPQEKAKYRSGYLVIRNYDQEGKKLFSAYHPPDYVRNKLLKDHVVLKHMSDCSQYQLMQDVWCVTKSSYNC